MGVMKGLGRQRENPLGTKGPMEPHNGGNRSWMTGTGSLEQLGVHLLLLPHNRKPVLPRGTMGPCTGCSPSPTLLWQIVSIAVDAWSRSQGMRFGDKIWGAELGWDVGSSPRWYHLEGLSFLAQSPHCQWPVAVSKLTMH